MSDTNSSVTFTAPPVPAEPATGDAPPAAEPKDWEAEAEKWKALSRKHESRHLESLGLRDGELDELRKIRDSRLTDQEKAVKAAREEAEKATLAAVSPKLVAAEFRIQASGRLTPEQVAELIEDLDMSKYLTADGEVDVERVAKKVDALAPKPDPNAPPTWPDLGQGARDTSTPALNSDELTQALMRKVGARR